jgi:AcrR family transcriptional regulator
LFSMKNKQTKAPRGRPRAFDCDEALDAAMRVFWKKGYDGTSMSDLEEAMGINRPSVYSAFGNKQTLFLKTMERYSRYNGSRVAECLASGSARQGMERLLRLAVEVYTDPANPGGCFSTLGTLSCSSMPTDLKGHLSRARRAFELTLRHRFDRAVDEGDLSRNIATGDLAMFYGVVFQGLSVRAKAGGTREELLRVVKMAMEKWPGKASTSNRLPKK